VAPSFPRRSSCAGYEPRSGCGFSAWLHECKRGTREITKITVFKQNSDHGVGFMALAKLAHDKAREAGLGIEI
jgi:hypothetical protein